MRCSAMARDWKAFIASLESNATFRPATSAEELQRVETTLRVGLPHELRSLLEQTDGVDDAYDLALVWPCSRILEDNMKFRTHPGFREIYMPFDPLLFFGDAGNGDQFAYAICGGRVRPDIFVWNHEDDSRSWKAPTLERYFEWWLSGKLKV